MNQKKYQQLLQQGFNRIPVVREVLADLDTPLSTYLKLANGPYSYLFESVHGGEKWGRYSIIGLPCSRHVRVCGHEISVIDNGEIQESVIAMVLSQPTSVWTSLSTSCAVLHRITRLPCVRRISMKPILFPDLPGKASRLP